MNAKNPISIAVVVSVATFFLPQSALAQGCVASRGAGLTCTAFGHEHFGLSGESLPPSSGFQAGVAYRWLHSDRHFVGDEEQKERQEEGSEVINDSHFIDVNVTYAFSRRISATVTFPFVLHDRSQVVRDASRNILGRFHTQASGLADIRAEGNVWLLDPPENPRGNVLLGLGFDAPTGEKDAKDTFQVFSGGQILAEERNVDQSIQPGDGGWGITADVYAFRQIVPRVNAYVNGAYTFTPEETSGVKTLRSNPFEAEMSIADSYMGRGGFEYLVWPKHGLTVSLGARIEGVPVYDAVGGSDGFRRPGYAISIEPGISAMVKSWSFGVYAPVAVYRNRERSWADIQLTRSSGTFRHGDAAFADFVIIASISKRL
ncbi:MAG TPA: hypothetical protein VK530_06380 [Candidatus Acidoferrum sp.]|nr:hypothetical protein [Candidatus Acidoferrum sp.]